MDELPEWPAALLCTHYFRDHSSGAVAAAKAGIPGFVPEGEHAIFTDPLQHFQERETYIIYDNLWDLFAPIEPVRGARPFRDYEHLTLAGMDVACFPLPGVTLTQSGYAVTLPQTQQLAVFCGEAIHSPGRLARLAPLQYNYNDIRGAMNCHYSARLLRQHGPDVLLPSLGEPILAQTDAALSELCQTLEALIRTCGREEEMANRTDIDQFRLSDCPPLKKVTDHVYLSSQSGAMSWFVISDTGKALTIDYGYNECILQPRYPRPARRRALLHGLEGLKKQFGIDRIDVALISHFHDDHVCGVPVLQRLFDTECWACETFADLLADPAAHCFPCTWPVPIRIDRRLPVDQKVQWEEFTFQFGAMSGHTRFAALIGFEADGKRFAHTGDQYFFVNTIEDFANNRISPNHVYRNGALLDGYARSARWMLDFEPHIVLTGHTEAITTDANYFKLIEGWTRQYEALHRRAMVLGDQETHFNLDSWGGWIWPYRTHLRQAETAKLTVTVRNPYPHQAKLEVLLVGPDGWKGSGATLTASPRAEVRCPLQITPSGPCRRQPFALELVADGQPFGQIAQALMTVGAEKF